MKTKTEIIVRIGVEIDRLKTDKGHMASITQGWIDALEWVLDKKAVGK